MLLTVIQFKRKVLVEQEEKGDLQLVPVYLG